VHLVAVSQIYWRLQYQLVAVVDTGVDLDLGQQSSRPRLQSVGDPRHFALESEVRKLEEIRVGVELCVLSLAAQRIEGAF
jgi:hypothetical protein